jgi:hypothetical protein
MKRSNSSSNTRKNGKCTSDKREGHGQGSYFLLQKITGQLYQTLTGQPLDAP